MKEITGFDAQDIESNKVMAALGYLFFLIPLLAAPNSKFAKFHTNQGFWFNVVEFAGSIILGSIPFLGWTLSSLFSLATLVAGVYLFYNAYTGKAFELPVVGNIVLFK